MRFIAYALGPVGAFTQPPAMKLALLLSLAVALAQAGSPLPSPSPAAPARVIVENPQSSFFPSTDQQTGVWQGCGPARDAGTLDEFNRDHPRARIVQVFIDAGIPCRSPGAHAFVIVYQDAAPFIRRSNRYPMQR